MTVTADPLAAYRDVLRRDDVVAISTLVGDLLAAGVAPLSILTDVVANAQREIGVRWQSGEISVAQERAATVIAMAATKVVADHVAALPVERGSVSIACVEREWHVLPAMIIECAFRSAGWATTMLGASTHVLRFNDHLDAHGPDAVALSASVLGSLPTARRFIEASTGAGVPILVGGSAFGIDDRRARALGATAWAVDAYDAVRAAAELPAVVEPAPPLPPERAAEQAALAEAHRHLVASISQRWTLADTAGVDEPNSVIDVANDVVHQILHALGAALLTGDPRPLPETAAWVTEVLVTRGGDPASLGDLAVTVFDAVNDYPLCSTLLTEHLAPYLGSHAAMPIPDPTHAAKQR